MATIDVDFDVFKALTALRPTESTTYNDVLRQLLHLPAQRQQAKTPDSSSVLKPWIQGGVTFPHGTEFRATYKGSTYGARVENGSLIYDGAAVASPSEAAHKVTGTNVNGWRFWRCKRPGDAQWRPISTLRWI
jgi:hypothetical protein